MKYSPAKKFLMALKPETYPEGHLSLASGFFPERPLLTHFPASHSIWNELIDSLPLKIRQPYFREFIQAIPELSAEDLPAAYLPLASTLLSSVAHLYWNCYIGEEKPLLPDNIKNPWQVVSNRLGRTSLNMDIIDLFINNWQLLNPEQIPPLYTVENMDIRVRAFANQAERVFYLTFVEMTYRAKDIVKLTVQAQDAVLNSNNTELKKSLLGLLALLDSLAQGFLKANLDPYSATYLNPLLLTKTTSFFGVPAEDATSTVSGAFSPIFILLDKSLGREHYKSDIGQQIVNGFSYIPQIYIDFFKAIDQVSIKAYIEASKDSELKSLFNQTWERYAGRAGLLSLHRDKAAYGILNVGTRVGRIQTVAGLLTKEDQPWVKLATTLDEAAEERPVTGCPVAVKRVSGSPQGGTLKQVALDMTSNQIYHTEGDHIKIQPKNRPDDIEEILALLKNYPADTLLALNSNWQAFLAQQKNRYTITQTTLGDFLNYGDFHQISLLRLHKVLPVFYNGPEKTISLTILLSYLNAEKPQALPQLMEKLSDIIEPLKDRTYSISSPGSRSPEYAKASFLIQSQKLDLTIKQTLSDNNDSVEKNKLSTQSKGICAHFLIDEQAAEPNKLVSIQVQPSHRFRLPENTKTPVIMIGIGSGVAPLRAFYRTNRTKEEGRAIRLFYGIQTMKDITFQNELDETKRESDFQYYIATSKQGKQQHITDLIKNEYADVILNNLLPESAGGLGAYFYVCGNLQFVKQLKKILIKIIEKRLFAGATDSYTQAKAYFHRSFAHDRFISQAFSKQSSYQLDTQLSVAEISQHNNEKARYWCIINENVYDITDYCHIHPGGHYLLQLNAGINATAEFKGVHAHINSENTQHLLSQYKIGILAKPDFSNSNLTPVYEQSVAFLWSLTGYQNLMAIDYHVENQQDFYWLLKSIEAHQRFAQFVLKTIEVQLKQLLIAIAQVDKPESMQALRSSLGNMPSYDAAEYTFPYSRNQYGDLIEVKDNEQSIFAKVAAYRANIQRYDENYLASIKAKIGALTTCLCDLNEYKPTKTLAQPELLRFRAQDTLFNQYSQARFFAKQKHKYKRCSVESILLADNTIHENQTLRSSIYSL